MSGPLWLGVLAVVLFVASLVAFVLAEVEPSHHIRTFSRSSNLEMAFERRATRLRVLGYSGLAVSVLMAVIWYYA